MNLELWGDINQVVQIIVLGFFIVKLLGKRTENSMTVVFFVFATAIGIVTDFYWLAHLLVKEGVTPDFSVAEFSMVGVFLLYGATVRASRGDLILQSGSDRWPGFLNWLGFSPERGSLPIVLAAVFTAANTLMWIGWNGGWFRDIITGLALGYYFCISVDQIFREKDSKDRQFGIFTIAAAILLVLETGTLFVSGAIVPVLEVCRYTIWFAGIIYFLIKSCQTLREENIPEAIGYTFTGLAWGIFTMYLSADLMYQLTSGIETILLIPAFLAVWKGAQNHDLF